MIQRWLCSSTIAIALTVSAQACGTDSAATSSIDAAGDDAPPNDAPAVVDAPVTAAATPCATSGDGAVIVPSGATCTTFDAKATGALATGVNASDVAEYALAPAATGAASGQLVLFFNPSLGNPTHSIADPATNIYTAGLANGHHVLAITYRSNQVIGVSCANDAACFLPTRLTVITGTKQPGAATNVTTNLDPSEGIYARTALALAYLAATQPSAGWNQFLHAGVDVTTDPAGAIDWSKVIVMGHSQGGGHAALVGKLQSVARIVMLSSSCDEVDSTPVAWQTGDASWQTPPATRAYGFAAATTFSADGKATSGDTTCPGHAAIWSAMGLATARRFDDASTCAGASSHTATTQCVANMARVQALLAP